ncbi:MAG: TolC family protein [Gemmatimonadetes bacterium]|nr:TolC family protein [Gemmatimonadota bacterium]
MPLPHMWSRSFLVGAALGAIALPLGAQQPAAPAAATPRALTLTAAYQLAEQRNQAVQIARAGVERAHGQEWQARSQYLPQLNAQLLYTKTLATQFSALAGAPDTRPLCRVFTPVTGAARIDSIEAGLANATNCRAAGGIDFSKAGFGAANQYQAGLTASLNLFTGGRVTAQNRVASAAMRTAELELRSQRAQLALNVAQAYLDAVLAERLLVIAESSFVQTENTARQVQLAKNVGTTAEFELLRAQVTRDNQRPVVIQRRSDREVARLRLKQVLNLGATDSVDLMLPPGEEDASSAAPLLKLLGATPMDTSAGQRVLVKQSEEAVKVQQDQFTVARSQRWPNVVLSSSYAKVAFGQQDFQVPNFNSFLTNWTVSLSASFPLFTGGKITGDEMVARANLREAEARLDQVKQGAAIDARQAFSQLEQAEAAWRASAGTSEQAARAYRIAEVRYREGISTQIELNDARILEQQARANRASAARNLQVARLRVALLPDLPIGAGTVNVGSFNTGAQPSAGAPSSIPGGQGAATAATAGQQGAAGGVSP